MKFEKMGVRVSNLANLYSLVSSPLNGMDGEASTHVCAGNSLSRDRARSTLWHALGWSNECGTREQSSWERRLWVNWVAAIPKVASGEL